MRKFGLLFISLSVILILMPGSLRADVKEYALDNGLKVLIMEDHKVPLATFQVWYRWVQE